MGHRAGMKDEHGETAGRKIMMSWGATGAVAEPSPLIPPTKRAPAKQDKALFKSVPSTIKSSILVVEDEAVVALDIQTRLLRMGYAVAGICSSGEDAILRASQLKPALVLMDIQLSGQMNGITAARQIRAERKVPVIFLTAYSNDSTIEQAVGVAPAGYLVKPFDDRTLKATIEIALNKLA